MMNFMQLISAYRQFTQNPMYYLSGMNVPQGMTDPKQIVQHLMNNGQMTQQQFNQLSAMAKQIAPMLGNK